MFGTPVESHIHGLSHLFPQPKAIALADLSRVGISDACANTLRMLASSIVHGNFKFSTMKTLNLTVSRLRSTCGVEESTANYIAMRAFGEPDAFPTRELDLGRRLLTSNVSISPGQLLAIAEQWRPWRAYGAMLVTQ
jgi:AraC family transcriptional regulator of adaptative response / DNA-3-methyladenine glycosylase II